MRISYFIVVSVYASCLTACDRNVESFARRHTSPSERDFALDYLGLLQRGKVDSAFAVLQPELKSPEARHQLVQINAILARHPVLQPELIAVQVNDTPGWRTVNFTWEYRSGDRWIVTNVQARYGDGGVVVSGVNVHPLELSLQSTNAFTVRNKSPIHFVWLITALLIPLLCVCSAIRVGTASGMPRRKRWVLASLIGIGRFSLNWTTGAVSINPVYLSLLGAGASRGGPAAPWIVSVSIPLGALLALQKYRAWRRNHSQVAVHTDADPAV